MTQGLIVSNVVATTLRISVKRDQGSMKYSGRRIKLLLCDPSEGLGAFGNHLKMSDVFL